MLFPYLYVPHSMEKMQEYIDFIFHEVWCKAPWQTYDISLFDGKDDLREIIKDLHNTEPKSADFFIKGIQLIFSEFSQLYSFDIQRLKYWYKANNDIKAICQKDNKSLPIRYKKLETCFRGKYRLLSNLLYNFCKDLYSDNFLSLKIISSKIGTIDDHHNRFTEVNKQGKCPFCGINDVKGNYRSKRDAYDHYLPKGRYPFNSINFKNLAPACHECNSTYKLGRDPLYDATERRRKSFYPYQTSPYAIELEIALNSPDWTSIKPDDVFLTTGPEEIREEINTWLDVYGIEERFKAKCCGENDGKYWIEQVLDEWKEEGKTSDEFLSTLARHAKSKPYGEANFLKKPFLEACRRSGLFDM
ncbi:MAG: hypothetical protein R6W88_16520 [Desulfobacterales bacterium]